MSQSAAAGRASEADACLEARGLTVEYDRRPVLRDVSLRLHPGELAALIGPNGAGKTTLLHTLCGILTPSAGEVLLDGRALRDQTRRSIARRVALVPQLSEVAAAVTVVETVALGRYPWMGPLAAPAVEDRERIESALEAMDLAALRDRPLETLSGGERQRVFLARALAQATPVLLLDEPAANLDLRYQQETFERLRALASGRGVAILVAEHQLNLVAAACDRVLLLHDGGLRAEGTPAEIVTDETLREVFGARMRVERDARGRPQCLWDF
jgi:iron complex transport system ATP-binding protein